MAGRKRIKRSGGGSIDLTGLFTGELGTPKVDSNFALESEIGMKPFDQPFQSDKPFKGNFWSYGRAGEMNDQYAMAKQLGGLNVANALKTAQGMTPIEIERLKQTNAVNFDNFKNQTDYGATATERVANHNQKLSNENAVRDDLIKDKDRQQDLLARLNIYPTDAAGAAYNAGTTGPLLAAYGNDAQAKETTSIIGKMQSDRARKFEEIAGDNLLGTDVNNSFLGLNTSKFNINSIPKIEKTANWKLDYAIPTMEQELKRNSLMPIPYVGVADVNTGQIIPNFARPQTETDKGKALENVFLKRAFEDINGSQVEFDPKATSKNKLPPRSPAANGPKGGNPGTGIVSTFSDEQPENASTIQVNGRSASAEEFEPGRVYWSDDKKHFVLDGVVYSADSFE